MDNLKSTWKEAGIKKKNQKDLLRMANITNHSSFRGVRNKFIVEGVVLTTFLGLYYDGFAKPLWANALLVAALCAYVGVRVAGWLLLNSPVERGSLRESLSRFRQKLKRMAVLVVGTSFFLGGAIILFFATGTDLKGNKMLVLAGMVLALLVLVSLSGQRWRTRIASIGSVLTDFEGATE